MKNYSVCVNLNLFEIDRLLSLLEEKEVSGDDKTIFDRLYKKLENYMGKIEFHEKDNVNKILEKQRKCYISKEGDKSCFKY
jgi:putative aminopeptidase FrvX